MADQNLMLVFCLRYSINFGNIWNNSGNGLKCSPKPWQSLHCLKHGCRHSLLWHDVQIVSICCRWLIRLAKSNFVILLSGFLFYCLRTHCTLFGDMPSSLWIILLVQNNNFIFFLSFHIFTDSAKETEHAFAELSVMCRCETDANLELSAFYILDWQTGQC